MAEPEFKYSWCTIAFAPSLKTNVLQVEFSREFSPALFPLLFVDYSRNPLQLPATIAGK